MTAKLSGFVLCCKRIELWFIVTLMVSMKQHKNNISMTVFL